MYKKKDKPKELTPAQKKKLDEHKKHHTAKHMATMRKEMRAGKTFAQAHAIAKKGDKKEKCNCHK